MKYHLIEKELPDWHVKLAPTLLFIIPVLPGQFGIAWFVRRRALRGDPVHEWVRNLALFFAGLSSPAMQKADLTDANLSAAHFSGADLRGAILRRTCFRGAKDLDWARTDPGPLRSVPVLHLLMSGVGAKQSYANRNLSELDLSYCDLRSADLSGCDLRGTRLPPLGQLADAKLKGAQIDALTYSASSANPDDLADWHERGVEIIALEAFPLAAQERIAGEREGLRLYFRTPLGGLDEFLIRGVILGVLGTPDKCKFESTLRDENAVVRLFDAPRADLERVAEALHRRVWEQASIETSTELAVLRGFLSPVDLRAGLSDLVQRLTRMTLRTPDPAAAPTSTAALATTEPALAAAPTPGPTIDRWDWRQPTLPGGGHLQLAHPCRVLLLFDPKDRALADELHTHLQLLHDQGAVVLSRSDDLLPGDVIPAARTERLREADVLLVLASPDLLVSDDCAAVLAEALRPRAEPTARHLRVVPVPLRPCAWRDTALGQHQPLPDDGVPLAKAPDRDAAFGAVASGLRRLALSRA